MLRYLTLASLIWISSCAKLPVSSDQPRLNRQPKQDQPIGIVRSSFLPTVEGAFEYSFETENGIKQQAVGTRKAIGENNEDVIVMKGSYEYIGADGEIYVVDWVADELGYRASAPHLPQPVEIPFPEQRAAVEAQLKFAEAEFAAKESSRKAKAVQQQPSRPFPSASKRVAQKLPDVVIEYDDEYFN